MNEQSTLDATYQKLERQWNDALAQGDSEQIVDQTVTQLEVLANQGHGSSLIALGDIFQNQSNKKRDEIRAFDYFEKAVKLKVPVAFSRMGRAYMQRNNLEKAFQYYQEGAELGSTDCMAQMGKALLEGEGTAKDNIAGIRWIKKAADEGDTEALFFYAQLLINGLEVTQDLNKAIEILELMFEKNNDATKAYQLFRAYLEKAEKHKDQASRKKSDDWLKIAANLGHERAVEILAGDKQDAQWKSLADFTNGKESYHFFYKLCKVIDVSTQRSSHTSSSGYGANISVNTTHQSWKVFKVVDKDGYQFEISDQGANMPISSGTNLAQVFVCKGGETEGSSFMIVDLDNDKPFTQYAGGVRSKLGYFTPWAFSHEILKLVITIILIFPLSTVFGIQLTLYFLAPAFWVYATYWQTKVRGKKENDALSSHFDKIFQFLKQK